MNKKPYVIGIAGCSGSGKTFFLNCFLNHFRRDEVALVSQDDYYFRVGANMSPEENKLYNFDLPTTIDRNSFVTDVQSLIAGEAIFQTKYTFNKPDAASQLMEVKPAPILVIEGIFILHFEEIARLLDMRIFIDTDEPVALERRLMRDLKERGYPRDNVLYKWHNHVLPSYRTFLLPHRESCDRIVTNNSNLAEDILRVTEEISKELRAKVLPAKQ